MKAAFTLLLLAVVVAVVVEGYVSTNHAAEDTKCDRPLIRKLARRGWRAAYCKFLKNYPKRLRSKNAFAKISFWACSPDPKKKAAGQRFCFNRRGLIKCIFNHLGPKVRPVLQKKLEAIPPVCRQRMTRRVLNRNLNKNFPKTRCVRFIEWRAYVRRIVGRRYC